MKKWIALAFFLAMGIGAASAQNNAVNGYCTTGGVKVSTSGSMSSTTVQASYPKCLVTVYLTGTTTLATLSTNQGGTALANPFTANANASWLFYAATGVAVDVVMSGGTPNAFPQATSLVGVVPGGGGGGGASFPSISNIVVNTSTSASRNAVFGDVVNLFGAGACTGFLKNDGTCSTSTASAAGTDTQVQINQGGTFGVDPLFTNNATLHNTSSGGLNAIYNSDLFISGGSFNNGFANLEATAACTAVYVAGVTITNGGSGYPASGNLIFSGSGDAVGTYTSTGGVITATNVSVMGYYATPPTVTIAGGTGFVGVVLTSGAGCNMVQPSSTLSNNYNYYDNLVPTQEAIHLLDNQFGHDRSLYYNYGPNVPAGIGIYRDADVPTCFMGDQPLFISGQTLCYNLTDTYSSPGVYQGSPWSVHHSSNWFGWVTGRSIYEMFTINSIKNSIGDNTDIRLFQSCRAGTVAGSDEGCIAISLEMGDGGPPFGNLVGASGANNTIVASNFTNNSSTMGDGQNLVDGQDMLTSGLITASVNGSGSDTPTITTSDTHAVSTFYGRFNGDCTIPLTSRNQPITVECPITTISGTLSAATGATVCVGDIHYPEQVAISSASSTSMTIGETYSHATGTQIYQGGMCGGKIALGNGASDPVTTLQYFTTYLAMGSRTSTTIDYVYAYLGGFEGRPIIETPAVPASHIDTITRVGSTVTIINNSTASFEAFLLNEYIAPNASQVCVSGVSGGSGSFNNCTGISNIVVSNNGATITYTQTGPADSGTGGSIQVVGLNNYQLPCGAETVALIGVTPLLPNGQGGDPAGNGSLQVEPNNCTWVPGNYVIQPTQYSQRFTIQRFASSGVEAPTGSPNTALDINVSNTAWGNGTEIHSGNGDSLIAYQGYGGTQGGHVLYGSDSFYSCAICLTNGPLNFGTVLSVGSPPAGTVFQEYSVINMFGSHGADLLFNPSTGLMQLNNGTFQAVGVQSGESGIEVGGISAITADPSFINTYDDVTMFSVGNGALDQSATVGAGEFIAGTLYAGALPPIQGGIFPMGTPGSTTYVYALVGKTQNGNTTQVVGQTTFGNATLSGANFNFVKFFQAAGGQPIDIYRVSGGGLSTGKICSNVSVVTQGCADTGQTATTALPANVDTSGLAVAADIQSGVTTNTDAVGELTFAAATTGTYTFLHTTNSVHPECFVEPQATTTAQHFVTYTGVTSFTINFTAAFTGAVSYHCYGRK